MALLSASGLRRTVEGRTLWQDLGLTVRAGESVAVTGPSGSGKSLLLRALAGLDPLEGGEVMYGGLPQSTWPMPQYRAQVTYLPQRPALDGGTVLDHLRRPFSLAAHRHRTFDVAAAEALLAALGREGAFLRLDTSTLSGGEGQLVALTRALLLDPAVLLLDEATASLDPEATRRAERLLLGWLGSAPRRALVWVSHDPAQRARVAPREVTLQPQAGTP
ncbi:ABC transporter ATP-binding protein [Deinococcus aetherius]|nr:ATP-binding cassette domain-containing protein [Deinococcus aetherius]